MQEQVTSELSAAAERTRAFSTLDCHEAYVDLASIWRDLRAGKYFVLSTLYTESNILALVQVRDAAPPSPSPSNMRILRDLLLGESPKCLALRLGVGISTVTAKVSECLRFMGREHRLSRTSALLPMAALAAEKSSVLFARVLRDDSSRHEVIMVARPDAWLRQKLTPAEFDVARLLVEGSTHAQIAKLRDRSIRTVANQLAGAFRRLNVSGRSELVSLVVRASESARPG